MNIEYPPIDSKWKERDLRVARTVQVIRYDVGKRRVRIVCIETDRLTWAKLERFNGKSGGYAPLSLWSKRQDTARQVGGDVKTSRQDRFA